MTNDDGADKIVSYDSSTGRDDRGRPCKLTSTRRLLIEVPVTVTEAYGACLRRYSAFL